MSVLRSAAQHVLRPSVLQLQIPPRAAGRLRRHTSVCPHADLCHEDVFMERARGRKGRPTHCPHPRYLGTFPGTDSGCTSVGLVGFGHACCTCCVCAGSTHSSFLGSVVFLESVGHPVEVPLSRSDLFHCERVAPHKCAVKQSTLFLSEIHTQEFDNCRHFYKTDRRRTQIPSFQHFFHGNGAYVTDCDGITGRVRSSTL